MTVLQFLTYVVLQVANTKMVDTLEYNFPVSSTETCPMNAKEWDDASVRRHCNDTHGYHCVPDKNFSSLIEFCYPLGRRIPFQKGNCLELAYTGILNHVKCGNFSYGCPEKDFFSNEIYLYPACLRLAENCFTADLSCLKKRYSEQMPREKIEANCTCPKEQSPREEISSTALIPVVIVLSVGSVFALSLVLILYMKIRKQSKSEVINFF
ncbi:uncharacterized protein LOC134282464 [Saccostrea cucullata]|uniref:uncharacterized protein LOC134282464 n=1 Tax=Saccostrea cuccullata TaxID=36930 RepID=UPI002ED468D3